MAGRGPQFSMLFELIIGKHMKMLCLKFQENRIINEEFDILRRDVF